MMARSHVMLGAASWLLASPHLGLGPAEPIGIALAAASSLLPDIDHPKSTFGRRVRPISAAIAAAFGHRGVTHSALAVLICAAVLLHQGAPPRIAGAVAIGYASHLAGDLLTPNGLRLAWPFRGTWALPLCRTGSGMETLIVAAFMCWAVWTVLPPRWQPGEWLYRPVTVLMHRDSDGMAMRR